MNWLIPMQGVGVNAFEPKQKSYPIETGMDVAKNNKSRNSSRCYVVYSLINLRFVISQERN